MELIKNKASGRFFVVLDDSSGPDFLVITPEGKIRRLERQLFEDKDISNPEEASFKKKVTKTQLDLYLAYIDE